MWSLLFFFYFLFYFESKWVSMHVSRRERGWERRANLKQPPSPVQSWHGLLSPYPRFMTWADIRVRCLTNRTTRGPWYGLSWCHFHEHLKRLCILLLLGGVFCKCRLDPIGWWYLLNTFISLWIFCLLTHQLLKGRCWSF